MIKRKMITILLLGALVLSIGTVAYAQENNLEILGNKSNDVDVSTIITEQNDVVTPYVNPNGMTDEERAIVESRNEEILKAEYEKHGKKYPTEESVVINEWYPGKLRNEALTKRGLPLDTKRITLDEVLDIIPNSNSVGEIESKICDIHGFYDWDSGSGFSYHEYWLDDQGLSRIIFQEYARVFLRASIDNKVEDKILYDEFPRD